MKAFLVKKFGPSKKSKSRNMAKAAILSVIQMLNNYKTDEEMKRVIKEMKDILKIVKKKKKLGEGRRLNFLVSDLVHMAQDAVHLYENRSFLAPVMEPIHCWIGEIKMRMLKLGVDEAETTELSNMRVSENIGEGDDQNVVGLEKDMEILLQMLLRTKISGGREYLSPTLIKGMDGIGKTTLARQLYNHADVVERFERCAWVCVSNVLTLKEVFIKLIQQVAVVVDGENVHASPLLEEMDNRSLLDMLCQHLKGIRYLIVLDDVPREIHLCSVWDALAKESYNGSRLLLTSHMTHSLFSLKRRREIHKMEFLDSKKSWQLFLKTINSGNKLTSAQKFPKSLEHKGKQMLRKCGGLPLAIKEVAKQLAKKKVSVESEWEQLLESVDFGSTLELLEPFYQKLDPKVKSCFLWMAFYKENTTLRAKKLIQIWTAGGVLSSGFPRSYSYIECLTNESVIEVEDKVTRYHMNPMLHRLSIKKAEEEIGFEILSNNGNNRLLQNPCHRVIICSRDKFNYSTNQDKHLVSLFFHGGGYFDASPSYWKSFEQLKILDLEDFGLKILPESIGQLMELRYLGLRNNHIQELPYWLGYCLKKLEVLDIAQNFMMEVPDSIWEMESLHHLYMSDVICQKPSKINALWNLKTLTYISANIGIYELLGSMPRLSKLGVEELGENSDVGELFAALAKLTYLSHLILRGCRFRSMPCLDGLGFLRLSKIKLDGRLGRLPNSFPTWLDSLTLVNSCLDVDPLPLLGKIRALHYLKLHNAYNGQQMVIMYGSLSSLEVLCIEELRNLRNIQLVKGGMVSLKKFEIKKCPYLDTLPEEIESIYGLKELRMVTTKDIAKKIRNSDLISNIEIVSINT